jgi:tetratricopeptide (TPR) repeat protein
MNDEGVDLSSDQESLIEDLMRVAARWLLADADPHRFINRLAQAGPRLFGDLFTAPPGLAKGEAAVAQAQFFRSFGWAIASAMPLPANGFAPRKLPLPGRNEACICGSLKKFKHCCAPVFEHLPAFETEGLGVVMLAELPRKQWASLPATGVPPRMVTEAAAMLCDSGDEKLACALLEPWAKLPAPWPAARMPLLDLLCDVYLDLGHPRKRQKLALAMVEHGDVPVQSAGWRRLSMMAADAGDADASHHAFERAQRLTPDEPDVALLEVTTLLGSGQHERAAERASFHAKRLSRLPHAAALADEIAMFEKLGRGEFPPLPEFDDDEMDGDDGSTGSGGARGAAGRSMVGVLEPDSPFNELRRWAEALPPPRLRLRFDGATPTDMGALAPAAALLAPLARWQKAFGWQAPTMAWETAGPEALDVFADERWSALLQRDPRLADCFEVLDGLMLVLDLVPLGLAAGLQAILMQRALALWAELRQQRPQARCEWAYLGNRPALRLLARRVELDTTPQADESFDWLQALVEVLNPHDNHGLRERLAAVYLRRGQATQALALCGRYPDDFVGMQLLHVRALLALQRLDEAAAMLNTALAANPHVRALLLARRAPRDPGVPSYAVGSLEQAKVAVGLQHDLWRDAPVRHWLQAQLSGAPGQGLF